METNSLEMLAKATNSRCSRISVCILLNTTFDAYVQRLKIHTSARVNEITRKGGFLHVLQQLQQVRGQTSSTVKLLQEQKKSSGTVFLKITTINNVRHFLAAKNQSI